MRPIFKTKMVIYQSKADLDEKILFGKIIHHFDSESRKIPGGGHLYIFLYGDVPLNRVSFSGFRLRDRVSFL